MGMVVIACLKGKPQKRDKRWIEIDDSELMTLQKGWLGSIIQTEGPCNLETNKGKSPQQ